MTTPLALLQAADPRLRSRTSCRSSMFTLIKMIVVFTVYMVGVALLTLAERKISAWIQDRHGPNRVGATGWLQPAADGVKNFMKEETYPAAANKPLFILAPMLAFIPALITWAVIPFGAPWRLAWGRIDDGASPICRSASSSSSRSRRSACTASCSPAGRRTTSTRCSADCARARR